MRVLLIPLADECSKADLHSNMFSFIPQSSVQLRRDVDVRVTSIAVALLSLHQSRTRSQGMLLCQDVSKANAMLLSDQMSSEGHMQEQSTQ